MAVPYNTPAGVTGNFDNNYNKFAISQSDVGRELVVKIVSNSTINNAELLAAIRYITTSHGSAGSGDSAFTELKLQLQLTKCLSTLETRAVNLLLIPVYSLGIQN